MTLSDIKNRITFLTSAGTADYPDADRLIAINKAIDDISVMILQSQDEWDFDDRNNTDFPILTTDLVNAQQDYSLPLDIGATTDDTIQIKRVEVTYDGNNWYRAYPIDINEMGDPTDTTTISSNFAKTKPYYDMQYGSIFLYPIPDAAVTGGLKIWINRSMTPITSAQLTAGTVSPGFDRQFHDMVAISAALDYAIAKGKANAGTLKNLLLEYEQRLKSFYSSKEDDRVLSMKAADVNYE